MTEEERKAAKERILDTAIALFAKRGYAAVGVREIAEKANVNISMISYYYNGKVGILKAIFEIFHDRYYLCIKTVLNQDMAPEESVRAIIHNLVDFVRDHTDLAMVAFNAMPLEIPEITELKVERVSNLIALVSKLFGRLGLDTEDRIVFGIIGPAVISIIIAHFRLRPIQKDILNLTLDESFYERYKEIISTIMLHGILGLASPTK